MNTIPIYHFTNVANLKDIATFGLLCDNDLPNDGYINSGSPEIKERRKRQRVPFGGVVADYVPFYFAPRSPMLYTQHINKRINQDEIIYLITDVDHIINAGRTWCCSDMNAAKSFASFYNTREDLVDNIRWDYMHLRIWCNTDSAPDRQDRRMAEFLVKEKTPWRDVKKIVTKTRTTERLVLEILNKQQNIIVDTDTSCYY